MNLTYKVITWLNLLGLVLVLGLVVYYQPQAPLGAQSNFSGPVNSASGYQESGTEIINTSGVYIGGVNTGSNAATLSGTNTISGASTFSAAITVNTATSTWNVNNLYPSSSTGPVIRAGNNTCYRIGLNSSAQFTTSTSACN